MDPVKWRKSDVQLLKQSQIDDEYIIAGLTIIRPPGPSKASDTCHDA